MGDNLNKGYAKVILYGEHFVVYGLPGIVAALDSYTTAKVEPGDLGTGLTLIDNRTAVEGYKEKKKGEQERAMELILKFMNIDIEKTPLKITLEGNLRCVGGRGASAAMATAVARALSEYFKLNLSNDMINEISYEGEKGSAGTPSGIDNTAATYGGLLTFKKNLEGGPNKIEKLNIKNPIEIVLANTGITQDTKEVVADIRNKKEQDPNKFERIFSDYSKLFQEAQIALKNYDLNHIGRLMNKNQELLREMTLSCPEAEHIIKTAKKNGALGAKLTGTCRGGSLLILTPGKDLQEKVSRAIEEAGFETLKTRIGISNTDMKVSAIANSNIALAKYWGKRDKEFMLPYNGSISMTTNDMFTHTTVEFDNKYKEDTLIVNGKEMKPGEEDYDDYMGIFMKVVRQITGNHTKVKIVSENNFPTAAGLASSASGFAAVSLAVSKALGLPTDHKNVSILARRGSGSASRSVSGGFVEWKKGEKSDGSDSFAEQIVSPDYWPEFRMIAVITSKKEKKIKSRAGMSQTVANCPFYSKWVETAPNDLDIIRKGVKEKNFTLVGSTAEHNCLKMHATMITTKPPIIYWNPATMEIIHSIMEWRDEGLESYFTIDAGPQVKVMCLEKDSKELVRRFSELKGVEEVILTKAGQDARLTDKHLF